jgi:hypothetical protein
MLKTTLLIVGLAVAVHTAGPRPELFTKDYNLCRAASLRAVRQAGGQPYRAGIFANQVCTWERADLQAGATLSTHPPVVGASLMRSFLAQNGRNGIKVKRIQVAGAAKAVLVTMPAQQGRSTRYLFAAYKAGTIQVNLTAPGVLPAARLIAVMRLVAR